MCQKCSLFGNFVEKTISLPIIAGGLIECCEEVENAIKAGASAVSTGRVELWG